MHRCSQNKKTKKNMAKEKPRKMTEDSCLFTDFVFLRRFLSVDVRTISENHRTRFWLCFPLLPRKLSTSSSKILPEIRVHVRGEQVRVSTRGGRGLRFFLCRRLPSPLFVPFSAGSFFGRTISIFSERFFKRLKDSRTNKTFSKLNEFLLKY